MKRKMGIFFFLGKEEGRQNRSEGKNRIEKAKGKHYFMHILKCILCVCMKVSVYTPTNNLNKMNPLGMITLPKGSWIT